MEFNFFPFFAKDRMTEEEHPVFAKDLKDVPDWLKAHHQWELAFDVNKLQKHQLKVKMCCAKCEEIVVEKIREVPGVFDVRAERQEKKVVVLATPEGLDEHEVLRKARQVHYKARFVELDAKEKQKPKGGGDKSDGQITKNKEQKNPPGSNSGIVQLPWGQPLWPRYLYAPGQIQYFADPHGQFVYFI